MHFTILLLTTSLVALHYRFRRLKWTMKPPPLQSPGNVFNARGASSLTPHML